LTASLFNSLELLFSPVDGFLCRFVNSFSRYYGAEFDKKNIVNSIIQNLWLVKNLVLNGD
jgi:putative component of membrane protein insertase Oxa1/YidC/SpoIIIJ protein YidD